MTPPIPDDVWKNASISEKQALLDAKEKELETVAGWRKADPPGPGPIEWNEKPPLRIAPTPKAILAGLAELRRLAERIDLARIRAFDAQDLDLPADTIAALAAAEPLLDSAEGIVRREIVRLRTLSRGVTFQPAGAMRAADREFGEGFKQYEGR